MAHNYYVYDNTSHSISPRQTSLRMYILMMWTLHFFPDSLECRKEVLLGHSYSSFINDLPNSVTHSSASLFADDTKMLLDVIHSDAGDLQSDLQSVSNWCHQEELQLNIDKCTILRFSYRNQSPHDISYTVQWQEISPSNQVPDLGILVNNPLSFEDHYKSMWPKAYVSLGITPRALTLQSVELHTKKQLYLTLVHSKLTCCSQ